MKNRKAQEEIVGFVLIVIIVAVVFLIFLGLTLRKGSSEKIESTEIYQFLESSMRFTSDCTYTSSNNYYRIDQLFEECRAGNKCLDGEDSCEILENTLMNIFEYSWNIGPESLYKGYKFRSFYLVGQNNTLQSILELEDGECLSSIKGSSYLIPAFPGKIETELLLCS
jgi:hypothetical protein